MAHLVDTNAGRFCWVDLAATDAARAKAYYGKLFGWTSREQPVHGGRFTYMRSSGQNVGSLYQLRRDHLDRGVPSHWTPYIRVDDVDDAARRASFDGKVIVRPFHPDGCRITVALPEENDALIAAATRGSRSRSRPSETSGCASAAGWVSS